MLLLGFGLQSCRYYPSHEEGTTAWSFMPPLQQINIDENNYFWFEKFEQRSNLVIYALKRLFFFSVARVIMNLQQEISDCISKTHAVQKNGMRDKTRTLQCREDDTKGR